MRKKEGREKKEEKDRVRKDEENERRKEKELVCVRENVNAIAHTSKHFCTI